MDKELYDRELAKGKVFFKAKYGLVRMYNNPGPSVPMLLHLYEQGEKQNELLSKIVKLLSLEKEKTYECENENK